jgi:hypothetical protein
MIVIGLMLVASVPLRRMLARRGRALRHDQLAAAAVGYGLIVGGTAGSGVILISMLMAAGLAGAAVIATDAAISIVIGAVKVGVFAAAGIIDARVLGLALMCGLVATPGAFLAREVVKRLPVRLHAAVLDGVVVAGGTILLAQAVRG